MDGTFSTFVSAANIEENGPELSKLGFRQLSKRSFEAIIWEKSTKTETSEQQKGGSERKLFILQQLEF